MNGNSQCFFALYHTVCGTTRAPFLIFVDNSLNDFRGLYDGALFCHIYDVFAFTFELNYRFDNDPHGNLGSSYIQISNCVAYSF